MHFEKHFHVLIEAWRAFSPSRSVTTQQNRQLSHSPNEQDFLHKQAVLEKILTQNILPFWYPEVIDLEEGGYRLNHDLKGKWKGPTDKHIVSQARTVWFFSRVANSRYAKSEYIEASRHGYEFLYDRMWDKQFGGFYWEVESSGIRAKKPHKHLYGQAFGLYALSEYAIASGDTSAAALAGDLFNILESYAHDQEYGGYREFFRRDWKPVEADMKSYLNTAPTTKLMNTHLHLLEAITTYYCLTKEPLAKERLIELILIQSNAVVRKTVGACTDRYQHDWTPLYGSRYERVCYGHDLENVWLLFDACNTAGISNGLLLDLYRTIFSYALQYGFDRERGGFYHSGSFNAPADRKEKIWWVQAESLLGALKMYLLARNDIYYNCFSQTLYWIVNHQIDWEHGDWHAIVSKNGKPCGDKAGAMWKSAYHNSRSVIECLKILSLLLNL